jgi:hypothetical protein
MIKNRTPEPAPEPETLSCRERNELAQSHPSFYPKVKGELSQRAWEKTILACEGRLPVSKLPSEARDLYGKNLIRIMGEILHHDGVCLEPPPDDEGCLETFARNLSAFENQRVRSGTTGGSTGTAAWSNVVGTLVVVGLNEVQDSLKGIARECELPTFLDIPVTQVLDTHALSPLGKGGTAPHSQIMSSDLGDWKVTRFATRIVVDDMDICNAVPGYWSEVLLQLGRAAGRTRLDRAWATILSNPVLELDGVPVFDPAHGNYSSTPLSVNAIGAAKCAIRRQTILAQEAGQPRPVHLNLAPRFLITTPENESNALQFRRLLQQDDPATDLRIVIESRMTNIGVRDPLSGNTIVGSPTSWMLSCDSTIPWLQTAHLQGQPTPKIRMSWLGPESGEAGRYGLAVDVNWPIAVKVADYRSVFFSSGTGS